MNFKHKVYLLACLAISLMFIHSSCEEELPGIIQTGGTPEGLILLNTTDGGETWDGHTIWPFPDAIGFDITQAGENKLVIAAQQREAKNIAGMILGSTDGGSSWRKEGENLQFNVLNSVFSGFYTAVAGNGSSIGLSTDNGTSWHYGTVNSFDMDFKSVAFNFAGTIGIGVGNCLLGANDTSFIYRSTDLGQTWSKVSTNLYFLDYMNFNDVVFTSYTDAIAVSDWGAFMRTTNTGVNWFISQAAEINAPLVRISIPLNSTTGFAAGNHGRIVKTQNSGISWINVETGITDDLMDVLQVNPNLAFAVGRNGIVLKSTNGGNSWAPRTIPYDFKNSSLRSVYFIDQNTGYIVGGD